MDHKSFHEFLKEQIADKGFSVKKIALETGIAERHLQALLDADVKRLPSAPYIRGYLVKIAKLLDLNSNALWNIYQEEHLISTSGAADTLPGNRYALRAIPRSLAAAAVLLLLAALYLGTNAGRLFGKPRLEIYSPPTVTALTNLSPFALAGAINPADRLLIGGEEVVVESNGAFRKEYALEPGVNQIEFSVRRFLGKEIRIVRRIIYAPE